LERAERSQSEQLGREDARIANARHWSGMRLGRTRAEGEKMEWLRLAGVVLVAAVLAGCLTYFVNSTPRVEPEQRSPPNAPDVTASAPSAPAAIVHGRSAEEFHLAAEAILKRLPDAPADAAAEPPISWHIPLPKRRPIPR
jgi:hypothetical protein